MPHPRRALRDRVGNAELRERNEASLPWRQHRPIRPLGRRLRSDQLHHRHLPVGNDVIPGRILRLTRRVRTLHIDVTVRSSGKKQIGFHPITFPVNMRIDAMRPLRFGSTAGRGNIVSRRSHPYFPSVVFLGQFPDTHVMPLGKSVE